MSNETSKGRLPLGIGLPAWFLAVGWIVLVALSFGWNWVHLNDENLPTTDRPTAVPHTPHILPVASAHLFFGAVGLLVLALGQKRLRKQIELQSQLAKIAATVPGTVFTFCSTPSGALSVPFSSPAVHDIFGLTPEDIARDFTPAIDRVEPEDRPALERAIQESALTLKPFHAEWRVRHPSKGTLWVEGNSMPERQPDGRTLWHGFAHDVTTRKRAEEQLRENELKYRTIFANDMFAICLLDLETGKIAEVNKAFAVLYGYTKEELESGKLVGDIGADPENTRQLLEGCKAGEMVFVPLCYHRKKDGREFPVELTAGVFDWKGRRMVALLTNDITDRRVAEQALQQARKDLEQAQVVGKVGSWISEVSTKPPLAWSDECCRVFGVDPQKFDGHISTFHSLVHSEDLPTVRSAAQEAFLGVRPYNIEHRIIRPDGSIRWVHEQAEVERDPNGKPVRMVGVAQDITERRRLEEQLRQSQKMEAIGRLAGGVAHDFNNVLTAILMQLSLLRLSTSLDEESRKTIDDLEQGANRAANLTRQLLLFSRQSIMQTRLLDLNALVDNVLKMLRRVLGEHIELCWTPSPAVCAIDGDEGMIEQVLMNLCVNARDAMPTGGRLEISTQLVTLGTTDCADDEEVRRGVFVCLKVSDNGCGMEEPVLTRIFEPFFTTKDVGKGTGLGLATVHGIVKQHRGWVKVASTSGEGSTFTVFLPASESIANPAIPRSAPTVQGGTETILLVEDENSLRTIVGHLLRQHGYSVLEARTGPEALTIWEREQSNIDLVFTDMVMPDGMTGLELADQLRSRKQDVKVILTSGYSTELTHDPRLKTGGVLFLAKPYEISNLAAHVRKCLDGSPELQVQAEAAIDAKPGSDSQTQGTETTDQKQ